MLAVDSLVDGAFLCKRLSFCITCASKLGHKANVYKKVNCHYKVQ